LTTQVHVTSDFHGGSKLERKIVFYRDYPRIDLDTRVDLHADDVLVTADFPLAGNVVERTRGIPYGFSVAEPGRQRAAAPEEWNRGSGGAILPSIRWSNYQLASGNGLALLDRGLTGHELNGPMVTLALVNAVSAYMNKPNELLRGQGVRDFSYALVPHAGSWQKANIPRMAWEFNAPPQVVSGAAAGKPQSFLETSPNVIVEATRRVGRQIEIRLVEINGEQGKAELTVRLPHRGAALTNMMGEKPQPLGAGPNYRFPIRPQQIVTLRLDTSSAVAVPAAVRDWAALAPPAKQKPLGIRILERGHPGR
jgi:alpha-mannosidase